MNFSRKTNNELERVKKIEVANIREKYPNRIPIMCNKDDKSKLDEVDKNKYLCPCEMTVGQFNYLIRKRLKLDKDKALFLLVNGKVAVSGDTSLNEIYERYKHEDGFLYINYTGEISWGLK